MPRAAVSPAPGTDAPSLPSAASPEVCAAAIQHFLKAYPAATLLENGKIAFDLATTQCTVSIEGARCTLHLWNGERNLVCTVLDYTLRDGHLRLSTQRFGQTQTRLLQLRSDTQRRSPAAREPARKQYQRLLERVLAREFPGWQPTGFRTSMDLERSFGPAYARGSQVQAGQAWAVIAIGAGESQTLIDGILTFGILWLHHCREHADGRRLHRGLRVIVPRGTGALSLARLAWLNPAAAQWQLWELDERTEELLERDPADQGNLRTKLLHLPDASAARERFAPAIASLMELVPPGEEPRVEQRLRSPTELAFLLHGLEFARIRLAHAPGSFRQTLEITCGSGPAQTVLGPGTAAGIRVHIAELFRRRNASAAEANRILRSSSSARQIGAFTGRAAHGRNTGYAAAATNETPPLSRLEQRERSLGAGTDPLFRAAPERWLESMLRENLAPLTRSLAAQPSYTSSAGSAFAQGRADSNQDLNSDPDPDPDTRGNRIERPVDRQPPWPTVSRRDAAIPHFNPHQVYAQVPAIAGASDRGLLDLLGVTADGRLAVIEVKASDDIQLPLQGLDYWIRVLQHHRQSSEAGDGFAPNRNELQRHGYFRDVPLSPLPPRLYLVAPALQIHPAVETVLRYLSPQVEWTLLALDAHWRQGIRVIWRKSGGRASPAQESLGGSSGNR